MNVAMTVEQIKEIRGRYGLSQKSFATLLGIGEASIVRYEKGATPSRANANLIIAAEDPRFMAGCIERNGEDIPQRQRDRAQEYIYAVIKLPEEPREVGEMSKMDEMYELTLQQEVLTEKCANIIGEIISIQVASEVSGGLGVEYESLAMSLSRLKPTISDRSNMDWKRLERIAGFLDCAQGMVERVEFQEAS